MSTDTAAAANDQLLDEINRNLEKFIRHALENQADVNLDYAQFFPAETGRKRCWEFKNCRNTLCPSRKSADYRCWLIAGTLCGGTPRGEYAQKYASCFECSYFISTTDTPAKALRENITTLIRHFIDRTSLLRDMATKDTLTGLYNRHFLNMIAAREMAAANRSGSNLSLLLIDIDRFKAINDTWGHLAGDRALGDFATFLRENSREEDVLFRLGGDEFLLLMTRADAAVCSAFGQRLLSAALLWNEARRARNLFPISFSMGWATATGLFSLDSLLHEADRKMYLNKVKA